MTNDAPAADPGLILHHYDRSPFAEKARLMLGFKGLPWRSVKVPPVMPKPDVVALTGGYRRTPFVQQGADVYCDTALVARLLERLRPAPPLFPADAPLAPALAHWADTTLFWTAIPYTMQPAGLAHIFDGMPPEVVKAFAADRAPFTAKMTRQTAADATVNLGAQLSMVEAQLARVDDAPGGAGGSATAGAAGVPGVPGGPWLLGTAAPCIADFAVAHSVWYVHRGGPVGSVLAAFPRLMAWFARVQAIGHGTSTAMSGADALAVAAAAPAHAACAVDPGLGFDAGQAVTVAAIDYGTDPVAGTLVGLSADEVVVERRDERAGLVHVHFPRGGFQIKAGQTA